MGISFIYLFSCCSFNLHFPDRDVVEHLFMSLFGICIFSLVQCVNNFSHLKIVFVFLSLTFEDSYILDASTLSATCFISILSWSMACLHNFLKVSSKDHKSFILMRSRIHFELIFVYGISY